MYTTTETVPARRLRGLPARYRGVLAVVLVAAATLLAAHLDDAPGDADAGGLVRRLSASSKRKANRRAREKAKKQILEEERAARAAEIEALKEKLTGLEAAKEDDRSEIEDVREKVAELEGKLKTMGDDEDACSAKFDELVDFVAEKGSDSCFDYLDVDHEWGKECAVDCTTANHKVEQCVPAADQPAAKQKQFEYLKTCEDCECAQFGFQ